MKLKAITLAAVIGSCGLAYGDEFLPFPKSPPQSASQSADYERQFGNSIKNLQCPQLGQLHDDLLSRLNAATSPGDRSYYARLIGDVTSEKALKGCPSQ